MPRNLDLTALRSFVTVAETGGVTRAAGFLNLTQSAVSMQLKRLEESLNLQLLDRSARTIALTAAGEQLLSYAKRMLDTNDQAWTRLTNQEFEGELVLGVPHDVIYPYIPPVLRRMQTEFPRMQLRLVSHSTTQLRELYGRGEVDAIVTTEAQPGPGGESLVQLPLVWIGAKGGVAWRRTPLPIAFCSNCFFRTPSLRCLDDAGVAWDMALDSAQDRAVEAMISADLAVTVAIDGADIPQTAPVNHGGTLPDPGESRICLYLDAHNDPVRVALRDLIRLTYRTQGRGAELAKLSA
ncbi:Transcriptional regulator, LysR family [Candidatus Rhodobacter oscarellae]|uniref:Transcriptional regulator, LysR family n=1 Tax=Candidatus Rhodobacter oscarellae TaxID=1675527 RepID=A0A0J9E3D3_9RHOB|nr:LysR family transcriptional regulator [Candidatus Rhodobacter lobularis]KMW56334.1 Transcriptional regulator, LysR family [Candidatus Rhodobacter lobularis]